MTKQDQQINQPVTVKIYNLLAETQFIAKMAKTEECH